MRWLFFQPSVYKVDDFLLCRLAEGEDACVVRSARTQVYVQVLLVLVLGERLSVYARSCPWVYVAIDVYHLGVVLAKEFYCTLVEFGREFSVFGACGQHQAFQVSLGGLYAEVFFERLGVVAVVSQFFSCLNVE